MQTYLRVSEIFDVPSFFSVTLWLKKPAKIIIKSGDLGMCLPNFKGTVKVVFPTSAL